MCIMLYDTIGVLWCLVLDNGLTKLTLLPPFIDGLAVSAQSFRKGANRVRKRMWWQNMKVSSLLLDREEALAKRICVRFTVDPHCRAWYHRPSYYHRRSYCSITKQKELMTTPMAPEDVGCCLDEGHLRPYLLLSTPSSLPIASYRLRL